MMANQQQAEVRLACGGEDHELQPFREYSVISRRIRTFSCIGLVWTTIVLLIVGIICAGVIPWQKYYLPAYMTAARVYYISAEEVNWTYTPGGKDLVHGPLLGTYVFTSANPADVSGTFIKAHFVAYTDITFQTRAERSSDWEHLGLLGPVIHAEAGDVIQIWLRNLLTTSINIDPMGNAWNIKTMLQPVQPGMVASYNLQVPVQAAPPSSSAQSSWMYLYRSSVNPTQHENAGLVGPIIVTRKGEALPDGRPWGVDREIVTVFQVFNEIETPYISFNAKEVKEKGYNTARAAMNGRSFGALSGLTAEVGQKVRWYVGGLGTENGMHNFHWHGNVLDMNGHYVDQTTTIPATTMVLDMVPDNPGQWLFHCHVNTHLSSGMVGTYNVTGNDAPTFNTSNGTVRTYYIAAEEEEWDYVPLGGLGCTVDGSVQPIEEGSVAALSLGEPNITLSRIGSKYIKAIFREYTDETFATKKNRSKDEEYLGFLGPLLRAQVGDTIRVVLKNNLQDTYHASLHPHGVWYNKSSEGSPYMDGTWGAEKADDAIPAGGNHTYIWHVPDRAGPGPLDTSSIMWMYHSHTDETRDTWAGLMGPMIITRAGLPLKEDGSPQDVDAERVLFFSAMDESNSFYNELNIHRYLGPGINVTELLADPNFQTNSLHRSINGYMYCNMPRMSFEEGSRVRFHFMSLGDFTDIHTPAMGAGGGFLNLGQRADAVQLAAGSMHSVDVLLTQPGVWRLHDQVLEHDLAGANAMYQVLSSNSTGLLLANGTVRTFYIRAENISWDFAPQGYVGVTLANFSARSHLYIRKTNVTIGSGPYMKGVFRQYTDSSYSTPVAQPEYLGIMGPLIILEPGDTLVVVFQNNLPFDINFQPEGGLVAIGSDDILIENDPAGASVAPGQSYTYRWVVPEQAGPSLEDSSSVGYMYSSTVDPLPHHMLGLSGMLVVARRGALDSTTRIPKDVDYLIPLIWQVYQEVESPYILDNIASSGLNTEPGYFQHFGSPVFANISVDLNDENFQESNIKHSINGRFYGNWHSPTFKLNSRVRWMISAVGSMEGLHSPVFFKSLLLDPKGPRESAQLMPGYVLTADMIADEPGHWPVYCNVHDHIEAGMIGSFLVAPP